MILRIFLVGIFGGLGSVARYLSGSAIAHALPGTRLPLGTFFVNLLGCFAIGIAAGISQRMSGGNEQFRLAAIVGFLGGFTTFSAFGLDTLILIRNGQTPTAVAYSIGTVVCGVILVQAGLRCSV
jgi:CrcB protein